MIVSNNPNYLKSEDYELFREKKVIQDTLGDISKLIEVTYRIQTQLIFDYDKFYNKVIQGAERIILYIDPSDIYKMGVELPTNDEFYYQEVESKSQELVDKLVKYYPKIFCSPYTYFFEWIDGRLAFKIYLGENGKNELKEKYQKMYGIDLTKIGKKENPNMKKTRKNNPNYLTEKKLDELETKKEFETERTLLDYVKHFEGLTEDDVDAIMSIIGKGTRAETKKKLESILKYSASLIPHYSIVDRLTKHRGRWSYTAGQSHTDEIARLRKIILTETGKKPNPYYEPENDAKLNELIKLAMNKLNKEKKLNAEDRFNLPLIIYGLYRYKTSEQLKKLLKTNLPTYVKDIINYRLSLIDDGIVPDMVFTKMSRSNNIMGVIGDEQYMIFPVDGKYGIETEEGEDLGHRFKTVSKAKEFLQTRIIPMIETPPPITEEMLKGNPSEAEHKKILNDLYEFALENVRGLRNETDLAHAYETDDSKRLDAIILSTLDPRVRDYAIYKKSMMMDHRLDKKNNPNYLKEKFNNVDKVKKLVDSGIYEVHSNNRNKYYGNSDIEKAFLDPEAFITSDLFRYSDYNGGYTIAKANILEIESRYPKLVDDELIIVFSSPHDGQQMEFKFDALNDENLYDDLLSIKDYPVLDDQTLSEVEMGLEDECWNSYGRDDWKNALIKKYGEAAENLTDEDLDNLAYEASQYTRCKRGEVEAMGFKFDIKGMIDSLDKFDKGKQLAKKENPIPKCENPSWAIDEDIWEKAKKQSQKSYGKISYPFVVYLYKQMGGKVKKSKK